MKTDMYYLGLGLILLGLLSLLVLFFSVAAEKPARGSSETPPARPVSPDLIARDASLPVASLPAQSAHGPVLASASVSAVSPPPPPTPERPRTVREPEQLVVFGSLFLDHGRNLSLLGRNAATELAPRFFQDFKRVGKGTLLCEENGFLFKSGHISHNYPSGDLEQIVFLSTGLAFVPSSPRSPVAIFLTDESDRVKAYIRDHAA